MAAGNDPHPPRASGLAAVDAPHPSEQRFRLLVENTGDDFYLHDDLGRFQDVNQRACETTGHHSAEAADVSNDPDAADISA